MDKEQQAIMDIKIEPKIDNTQSDNESNETKTSSKNTKQKLCENCAKCVCKEFSSQITPEFVNIFKLQVDMMQKLLESKSPQSAVNQESLKEHEELYPNTNIRLSREQLQWVLVKSNYNLRAYVRYMILELVNKDDLLNAGTAEKYNKLNPMLRKAIIGHVINKFPNVRLTTVEYNDILNKKMQLLKRQLLLSPEEAEKEKLECRKRAMESRRRKKLLQDSTQENTKVRKTSPTTIAAASSTIDPPIQVKDEIVFSEPSLDDYF